MMAQLVLPPRPFTVSASPPSVRYLTRQRANSKDGNVVFKSTLRARASTLQHDGAAVPKGPLPETWSNPHGLVLTEIVPGTVWAAERPFVWNGIDVGGRMAVVKMADKVEPTVTFPPMLEAREDGTVIVRGGNYGWLPKKEEGGLWVHSPVSLDALLNTALAGIGEVRHVVSPNFEHVKYAAEWISAFPNATSYGCPGLSEQRPDIPFDQMVGINDTAPQAWKGEFEVAFFDCERNPFNNKPFFNEVLFFHRPSRALFVTDLYWNYPSSDLPQGSWAWKQGMDRIYLPFYRCFMINDRDRFKQQVEGVLSWDFDVLVPCHGSVVYEGAKEALREHLMGRASIGVWAVLDEWKERVMEQLKAA